MIGYRVGNYSTYFDKPSVMDAMDKVSHRALSQFGAFVRNRSQASMLGHPVRKGFGAKSKVTNRQGVAPPGKPPLPHLGLIVKWIRFDVNKQTNSVVIGPALLRGTKTPDALHALEAGGPSVVLEKKQGRISVRRTNVREHPFMRPAFNAELPGAPRLWKDGLRKV